MKVRLNCQGINKTSLFMATVTLMRLEFYVRNVAHLGLSRRISEFLKVYWAWLSFV